MGQGAAVVRSVEERLQEWREMDRRAREAEAAAGRIGQAGQDPRAAELFRAAGFLRRKADRELAAILRAVRLD